MSDNNTGGMHVIKASAGSGKTFTLAKCYIEQLLFRRSANGKLELRKVKDYHQHILAITFTNKAANEMKERILKELYILAHNPSKSDHYEYFRGACTAQSFAQLQQAAGDALATILFNYSSFRVGTIDSFFQSILRNFARELDRDYNYEIELKDEYAIKIATHNFLLTLGKDHERAQGETTQVEEWVKEFLRSQLEDSHGWDSLFSDRDDSLFSFAKSINNEFIKSHMDELCRYLSSDVAGHDLDRINAFNNLLKQLVDKSQKKLDGTDWQLCLSAHMSGIDEKDLKSNESALLRALCEGRPVEKLTDTVRKSAFNAENLFKKGKAPHQGVLDSLEKILSEYVNHFDSIVLFKAIAKKLSFVGLLGEINKKLEEYRQESNTVLISDANELIGRVVEAGGDAPFIYERTGTWINHYMLDEFQDTSNKQYHNFLPLLKESLSHGSDNFNLVIGDSKQAIYKFRNADASLFRDKIDEDFAGQITPQTLEVNWRSLKNIVDFNNAFTGQLISYYPDLEALQKSYMPGMNEQGQRDPDGYRQEVAGKFLKDEPGMVKVMFKSVEGAEFKEVDNVVEIMPEYLLELHKRFPWKDIIILVNMNSEGSAIVKKVLDHNKLNPDKFIPIVSSDVMTLNRSTAVRRLVSLLRFIDLTTYVMNNDEEDQATEDDKEKRMNKSRLAAQRQFLVLSNFVKAVGECQELTPQVAGTLLHKCFNDADELVKQSDESQTGVYSSLLNTMLPDQRTQVMSLGNIVEHLIASQLVRECEQETIYIHAFQNTVMSFMAANNGGTVREFLRYWDENGDSITVPDAGDSDAINVLTIHKSKGLEANCVIVPCARWSISKASNNYWVSRKEWLDNGGRQLLDSAAPGAWNEYDIPPIMMISGAAMKNFKNRNMFNGIWHHEDEDMVIDKINKTYVAFTRPCRELHIFGVGGAAKKNSTSSSINRYLQAIVPKIDGFVQTVDGQYQLGRPCAAMDSGKSDDSKKLPPYVVGKNRVKVSLPVEDDPTQDLGTRLHLLLSRIEDSTQLDKALNYCLRRGIITDDPADEWNKDRLHALFSQKFAEGLVAQWFEPGNRIYNERSLLRINENRKPETRRPDRIVERPDGSLIIVDYKFGQNKEDGYIDKMHIYMDALRDSTGREVKGYLWYVALDEIIEIPTS